jgi:hypothetical protein
VKLPAPRVRGGQQLQRGFENLRRFQRVRGGKRQGLAWGGLVKEWGERGERVVSRTSSSEEKPIQ